MKDKVDRAAETIKKYCASLPGCAYCRWYTPDGVFNCPFTWHLPPQDWEPEKWEKEAGRFQTMEVEKDG